MPKRKIIFATDEYPYLAASYPAISSLLQKHINACWKNTNLFLILCGSSMSFMEHQVLGYKSPLYGRRTAQFKLKPFTFFESRELLNGFEPQLGIIKKECPVTEKENSRKTIYHLEDSMFLFWYRFVRPNITTISMNAGTFLYENYIKPQLSDFMGSIFEDICRQYLYRPDIYPTLPFPFGTLGRWWGSNPAQKRQEEIDIAAIGENRILLGECKWKNGKVGADVLMTLVECGTLFSYPEKYYYVFSKSGFEETTKKLAEEFGIRRISFTEML